MTISEFWNAAFLAALHRVSAVKAKTEADKAAAIVIAHWAKYDGEVVITSTPRTELDIVRHPRQVHKRKDLSIVRR